MDHLGELLAVSSDLQENFCRLQRCVACLGERSAMVEAQVQGWLEGTARGGLLQSVERLAGEHARLMKQASLVVDCEEEQSSSSIADIGRADPCASGGSLDVLRDYVEMVTGAPAGGAAAEAWFLSSPVSPLFAMEEVASSPASILVAVDKLLASRGTAAAVPAESESRACRGGLEVLQQFVTSLTSHSSPTTPSPTTAREDFLLKWGAGAATATPISCSRSTPQNSPKPERAREDPIVMALRPRRVLAQSHLLPLKASQLAPMTPCPQLV